MEGSPTPRLPGELSTQNVLKVLNDLGRGKGGWKEGGKERQEGRREKGENQWKGRDA